MDSTEKKWREFWHGFIENGLLDDDRKKTTKALRKLSARLPEEDSERIPGLAIVFATSADTLGLVQPEGPKGITIYLSPCLKECPKPESIA